MTELRRQRKRRRPGTTTCNVNRSIIGMVWLWMLLAVESASAVESSSAPLLSSRREHATRNTPATHTSTTHTIQAPYLPRQMTETDNSASSGFWFASALGWNLPIRAGEASTSENLVYKDSVLYYSEPSSNDEETTITNEEEEFRPDEEESGPILDIDCERFFYLQVCRDYQSDVTESAEGSIDGDEAEGIAESTIMPPPPLDDNMENKDPEPTIPPRPPPIDNIVSVQVSVGLEAQIEEMELFAMVVARVVTRVIDFYTPFDAYYFQSEFTPQNRRSPNDDSFQLGENTFVDPFANFFASNQDDEDEENDGGTRKQRDLSTSWRSLSSNNNDKDKNKGNEAKKSEPRRPPPEVDLLYAWTLVEPLPRTTTVLNEKNEPEEIFWYWTRVEYAAFFDDPPVNDNDGEDMFDEPDELGELRPIKKADHIGNITWVCQQTINDTIVGGVFTAGVQQAIAQLFGETILIDGAAAPQDTPQADADASTSNNDWGSFYGVTIVGDEDKEIPSAEPGLIPTKNGNSVPGVRIYTEPLNLEFGLREWFGLALGVVTILSASTLVICAGRLQKRQFNSETWGAVFTEDGINNILQVGWRYQEEDRDEGYDNDGDKHMDTHGGGQLFLQVYDKTKLGYNDEDSLLQGGVERSLVAPTLPTSGGATTLTPGGAPSSRSSNEESSHLPSSAFTPPSPEARRHNYEEPDQQETEKQTQSHPPS